MERLEIEFLGTGTSTGVPSLRCGCEVCRSSDPRDNRMRCSAVVRYKGARLLLDCSPDFRTQMLRASDDALDALLLTHIHFDHIGGIEDLRAYCLEQGSFPIYARQDVIDDLYRRLAYCFNSHPYPGVPHFDVHPIREWEPFTVAGVDVLPLPVLHYRLPILAFLIGPMAYITDAKYISDEVTERLRGIPLLVINTLRRSEQGEHFSHFCLDETLAAIRKIQPGRALLIHMSHGIGPHAESQSLLPDNVSLAYDGLITQVETPDR